MLSHDRTFTRVRINPVLHTRSGNDLIRWNKVHCRICQTLSSYVESSGWGVRGICCWPYGIKSARFNYMTNSLAIHVAKKENLPQSACTFHTESKNNLDKQLQVASKHESSKEQKNQFQILHGRTHKTLSQQWNDYLCQAKSSLAPPQRMNPRSIDVTWSNT